MIPKISLDVYDTKTYTQTESRRKVCVRLPGPARLKIVHWAKNYFVIPKIKCHKPFPRIVILSIVYISSQNVLKLSLKT